MELIFRTSATNVFKDKGIKPSKIITEARKTEGDFGILKDGFNFFKNGSKMYIY